MKKLPFLLFFFILNFIYSQQSENNGFRKLPEINNFVDLIKKINPNPNYKVWALVHYDFRTNEIIYQKGNQKITPKRTETDRYGFFACLPGGCYYYFYAINKNNKAEYILKGKELLNFLGKINNVEEALFIAMLYGYVIDNEYEKGNIYKEFDDEFILYLSKISTSPYYKKEAFIISVKKNGEVTVKSDGVYYYDKNIRIDI